MPHPLEQLTPTEIETACEVVRSTHPDTVIDFREVYLQEPPKKELRKYLDIEHATGVAPSDAFPPRLAKCQYDVVGGGQKVPAFCETLIDVVNKAVVKKEVIGTDQHASLTFDEFNVLVDVCKKSKLFQDAIAELKLDPKYEVVVEPWPYGGLGDKDENRRYFQGLIFANDLTSGNPDSNFYAFPLPLIPILDYYKQEIIRIDRLATGGKGDAFDAKTHAADVLAHCKPAEYVPELLAGGTRKDLKPLNVLQPEGASFTVGGESLVEWQKWRFRVGFNPREGATIHDVHYENRSIMARLSISEMTVPYADARDPFVRKQAFDFGDGGAGTCANNLSLGCDCLGLIKYFDGITVTKDGKARTLPNAVCLHEQDNGIGWKHTNWRTGRAVVTRSRELVVQFIITLANYEYVFAYKFDQAGGITIETRATGIVSVVNIDPGKTSAYGNVVQTGVLAQNHQHIFCVRIDPAIEGDANTVLVEESHTVPTNPETNPNGNYYEVRSEAIKKSSWLDAAPLANRVLKMVNPAKTNPVSGKPIGYKLTPSPTQLLLADPNSLQAKRALFAQHHIWVTKHRDDELYAAGRFTLQSRNESGGVADMVARNDDVEATDVVVWSVFGLTHNPRVEDWPVMPVEIHHVTLRPADFFTANPALDVPSNKNMASELVERPATNGTPATNGVNGHAETNGNCCH